MLEMILPFILSNWIWVAVMLILWKIGNDLKKVVPEASKSVVWRIYWSTLPFHPIIAGCLLGFVLPIPASIHQAFPFIVHELGGVVSNIYYTSAGVASTVWYDFYKSYTKAKTPKSEE